MTHQTENRESFLNRLRPVLAPSELLKVEIAYALAKHAHRHQERKELDSFGRPIRYFEHLRGTALIAVDELGISDPEIVVACLMHDVIEDTHDVSAAMLEYMFGAHVAQIVTLLTKTEENKAGYFDRLSKHADVKTLIVKGCDRLHNMRSMKDCDAAFVEKQIQETEEHVIPLLYDRADDETTMVRRARSSITPLLKLTIMLESQVGKLEKFCRENIVEQ